MLFVHGKSLVHVAPLVTTDLEKAILRAGSPLKQSYVRLRVSNRNPRHPNTLAKSLAQCEIFMQKDVCGPGRGALQSPCAPQPWPSGRGTRAGACAQACLVDMSASTVPLHLLLKLRVMLPPCRQNARTVIELSQWPEVTAARSTAARKFAPYRSNRQTKSIRRHLCEMQPRFHSPRVGQRRLFDVRTKPGPSSTVASNLLIAPASWPFSGGFCALQDPFGVAATKHPRPHPSGQASLPHDARGHRHCLDQCGHGQDQV
jgi:hypothetical protein